MNRRSLLLGLGAALAAPAIVRPESIMRIAPRALILDNAPIWTGAFGTVDPNWSGWAYSGVPRHLFVQWSKVLTVEDFDPAGIFPSSALPE